MLILVIDDDITSLDLVSFLFERRGFRVERCADGHAAIEFVRQTTPDIILVDLLMPQINGIETVREIRALGLDGVPILAFTAVDEPELHARAMDAGCDKVITKPCGPEALMRHISQALPGVS